MHEVFRGVCVIEPKPGPIDIEKVEAGIQEVRNILAQARVQLGMNDELDMLEIPVSGRDEAELKKRIADNEKRGWKVKKIYEISTAGRKMDFEVGSRGRRVFRPIESTTFKAIMTRPNYEGHKKKNFSRFW